ncbi:MAG: hypothetical protein ABIR05_02910 [Luteimonas sp.]
MTGIRRWALLAIGLAVVAIIGWQIVAVTLADRTAGRAPMQALRWRPDDPDALLALARQQLQAQDRTAAAASARAVLAQAPLQGEAFAILAQSTKQEGAGGRILALYRIAARRAPRDPVAHAWLADRAMQSGDYAGALLQIDLMYRVVPSVRPALLSALMAYTAIPGFADALVEALGHRPDWRSSVISALLTGTDQVVASRILGALQRQGGLEPSERQAWLANLMSQDRWGEAYARWVGALARKGNAVPAVYNGGFDTVPGEETTGFDWRVLRVPGVLLEFVHDPGAPGLAAHAMFLGRPVTQVNLEHPLLLGPGRYRLQVRMRAEDLRSSQGLAWTVTCRDQPKPLASSARIEGSFGWRELIMDLVVPAEDCAGQWLRLQNPAPPGWASTVSGSLWFDEVAIHDSNGLD